MAAPRTADAAPKRDVAGEEVSEEFLEFLETYNGEAAEGLSSTTSSVVDRMEYVEQLIHMKQQDSTTIYIDFQHIMAAREELADAIRSQYYRFMPYLQRAVQEFVRNHQPHAPAIDEEFGERQFWVSFFNLPMPCSLRELRTDKIGQLLAVGGTVTRTSEVRPELLRGTFTCVDCGTVVRDVEQQFKFNEPTMCRNATCSNRTRWTLDVTSSEFCDWQRVRMQENAGEIPSGAMPRTLDIILRNEIVEEARAGDKVVFSGTLIVIPDVSQLRAKGEKPTQFSGRNQSAGGFSTEGVTGLKRLGVRELTYRLAFLACSVQSASSKTAYDMGVEDGETDAEQVRRTFSSEDLEEINAIRSRPDLYISVVKALCPHIHGHEDIKRGILLMLLGGVTKKTKEGMKLRGDINVCIVGDPSTAKSQFLKYVQRFLPRAVFTSGKSSSAAGLTASVVKDPESGEFTIEAGALMLADNGVCCIDEFDKMDDKDQVAIHEAMEQQTISIAKAGIQATLNARTSILAAANPINGRYDKSRTLRQNITMTAPIMSRFDLFFVVVDDADELTDHKLARHMVTLHQQRGDAVPQEISLAQLQRYVRYARTVRPVLSNEAKGLLVRRYRLLRQGDAQGSRSSYRVTVRQLESMIRLSEALARLHLESEVRPKYVEEAARLLGKSILRVESEAIELLREVDEEGQLVAEDEAEEAEEEEEDAPPTRETRKGFRIKFEEYQRLSHLVVMHLRKLQEEAEEREGGEGDQEEEQQVLGGLSQRDIVQWLVEQHEEQFETRAESDAAARLYHTLINRLVQPDHVLVDLNPLIKDSGQLKEVSQYTRDELSARVLVVHPNYTMEEE